MPGEVENGDDKGRERKTRDEKKSKREKRRKANERRGVLEYVEVVHSEQVHPTSRFDDED